MLSCIACVKISILWFASVPEAGNCYRAPAWGSVSTGRLLGHDTDACFPPRWHDLNAYCTKRSFTFQSETPPMLVCLISTLVKPWKQWNKEPVDTQPKDGNFLWKLTSDLRHLRPQRGFLAPDLIQLPAPRGVLFQKTVQWCKFIKWNLFTKKIKL